MGNECCTASNTMDCEQFIETIFKDPNFKLKNYDYMRLLNKMVDYRIMQELHKKYIEEKIIPNFFENSNGSSSVNDYIVYHYALFTEILGHLQEKNNMYDVILYFFPFIDHSTENVEATIYSIFNYIGGQITLKLVLDLLGRYLRFIFIDLTKVVKAKTENSKMKKQLNDSLVNVFTDENIEMYLARKLFDILKVFGENEVIPKEEFIHCIQKLQLGSFSKARILFYSDYA